MTSSLPVAPRPLRYGGLFACAAVILYASVVDPGDGAAATLLGVPVTVYLHVVAYGGLAGAVGYARLATDGRTAVLAVVVATLFGAAVEVVQGFVPYRTASVLDVVVNAAGAILGASIWLAVGPWFGASARATPLSGSTE